MNTGNAAVRDDEWMDTAAAAAYLCRSPHTLRMWRRLRTGPKWFRPGNNPHAHVLYRRSDLDAWAERTRGDVI